MASLTRAATDDAERSRQARADAPGVRVTLGDQYLHAHVQPAHGPPQRAQRPSGSKRHNTTATALPCELLRVRSAAPAPPGRPVA